MRKAGVLITCILLIVLVSGIVSASDVIMKISSSTNAHGETASESNYAAEVTYSSIFGAPYEGASPNICTGSNLVLKLSSATNAHAEVPTETNYGTDVCYGDLVCTSVTGGASCPVNTMRVVKLSDTTNAHLETRQEINYDLSICCSSLAALGPEGVIVNVYWTDNTGNKLPDTDSDGEVDILRYVNNKVWLVAETSLSEGEQVIFDIKESDALIDDDIRLGLNSTADDTGKAIYVWEITPDDIVSGGSEDVSKFYFGAAISGDSETSNLLRVKNEEGHNSDPIAIIDDSTVEDVYAVGQPITITHNSADPDSDIVSVEWDVDGDGVTDYTGDSITHTFDTPGVKVITITVTDSEGATDSASITITIVDPSKGINIVPLISAPKGNNVVIGKIVDYDGSLSFALEVSNLQYPSCKPGAGCAPTSGTFECAGGDCPDMVGNLPVTDPNGKDGDFSGMSFKWTYGTDNPDSDEGLGKITGTKIYSTTGENKVITLEISMGEEAESTSNTFDIIRSDGCSDDGTSYLEGSVEYSTSIPGVCSLVLGVCCPAGQSCVSSPDGSTCSGLECTLFYNDGSDFVSITKCDDYNKISRDKQAQCEADCNDVGNDDDNPEYKSAAEGGNILSSSCIWDTTDGCVFNADYAGGYGGNPLINSCTQSPSSDTGCVDGFQTISYDVECDDGSTTTETIGPFSCGRGVIQLPFIGAIGILLTVLIISLVYLLKKRDEN